LKKKRVAWIFGRHGIIALTLQEIRY